MRKDDGWTTFSDFHEITHIVIKEAAVTVYIQDNRRMVREFRSNAPPLGAGLQSLNTIANAVFLNMCTNDISYVTVGFGYKCPLA